MVEVTGILTNETAGLHKIIPRQAFNTYQISLSAKQQWDIGIDQSTSCTGICIQSIDKAYRVLLDVHRGACVEKREFYRMLQKFLERTVRGKNIRFVITERPAPKAGYSARILEELLGHLENMIDNIDELSLAKQEAILPQTWKHYIVDKSKGTNRSKYKENIAEDLCDRFPTLLPYFLDYPYTDYDSFDACGILNGFMEYAYTPDGSEKIHGMKEKRHVSFVAYEWVPKDNLASAFKGNLLGYVVNRPIKLLAFNDAYDLHTNIRMASSNNELIYTILPKKQLNQFMWKYGIDPEDDTHVMVMLVARKGKFTKSEYKQLQELYKNNSEVYDE